MFGSGKAAHKEPADLRSQTDGTEAWKLISERSCEAGPFSSSVQHQAGAAPIPEWKSGPTLELAPSRRWKEGSAYFFGPIQIPAKLPKGKLPKDRWAMFIEGNVPDTPPSDCLLLLEIRRWIPISEASLA